MDIRNKCAVVTGGASGLGRATAERFIGLGADVVIFDLNTELLQAVAEEIGARAVTADVSSAESIERAFESLPEPPRVVVNCAGIAAGARVVGKEGKLSLDLFDRTIRVNLIGTYNVMSYAAKAMSMLEPSDQGERGVIINTASVAYEDGQLGQCAYSASKGGVASMTLPAARELAQLGIRVNAIAPGLFHTPMMESLPEEIITNIASNIPFPKRFGLPKEYAQLAEHIINNTYINGTVIRLDGSVRLPIR